MEKSKIKEAWDICEVEKLEQFNAYRISPAVFKPEIDSDFIFKD